MTFDLNSTETNTTHLLYDGKGGWIEAKRVWMHFPHPEVDGVEDGWGWRFRCGADFIRWLES